MKKLLPNRPRPAAPRDKAPARGKKGLRALKDRLVKRVPVPRRILVGWGVALSLTGLALIAGGIRTGLCDGPEQQLAELFGADGTRYAHVSCYFASDSTLTADRLQQTRAQIQDTLTRASMKAGPDARLWVDAATFDMQTSAASEYNTATVTATGIAGDWWLFAPGRLLTGSWMRSDDEQKDTVVLDEQAAWLLFGSADVTGQLITLADKTYTVCGVVALPTDAASKLTYGANPRVWTFGESLSPAETLRYTSYTVLLPQPTTGYAEKLLQDTLGDGMETVNQTTRYTAASLVKTLKNLPRAALRSESIAYPWQENAALWLQTRAALWLAVQLVLMAYPCLWAALRLIHYWRRRPVRLANLAAWVEARRQQRLQQQWEKASAADRPDPFAEKEG